MWRESGLFADADLLLIFFYDNVLVLVSPPFLMVSTDNHYEALLVVSVSMDYRTQYRVYDGFHSDVFSKTLNDSMATSVGRCDAWVLTMAMVALFHVADVGVQEMSVR